MLHGRTAVAGFGLVLIVTGLPSQGRALTSNGDVRLVVSFSAGMESAARAQLHDTLAARVLEEIPQLETVLVEAPPEALDRYSSAPGVLGAIEDFPVHPTGPDPDLFRQWGLENEGQPIGASGTRPVEPEREAAGGSPAWDVDAVSAWTRSEGEGVLVAVIDTGVDDQHPELGGRVLPGTSFVEEPSADCEEMFPGRAPTDDEFGHGTHVAGIIAAARGNGLGGAGVAPRARILPVKVFDCLGAGATYFSVAEAIVWATDNGAGVINLSLGGTLAPIVNQGPIDALASALDYAVTNGALPVCGAGNDSAPAVGWPAMDDACIAVIATGSAGTRATFSNYGLGADVAAPGHEIFSTLPERPSCMTMNATFATCPSAPPGYGFASGTSMATPMVAGAAALLSATGLGPEEIRGRLEQTASQPAGAIGVWTPDYGWGLINAARALGMESPARAISPAIDPSAAGSGQTPIDHLVSYPGAARNEFGWITAVIGGESNCRTYSLVFTQPVELTVRWGPAHPYENVATSAMAAAHNLMIIGEAGSDLHYTIEGRTMDGRTWPGWSFHAQYISQVHWFCSTLGLVPDELRTL